MHVFLIKLVLLQLPSNEQKNQRQTANFPGKKSLKASPPPVHKFI